MFDLEYLLGRGSQHSHVHVRIGSAACWLVSGATSYDGAPFMRMVCMLLKLHELLGGRCVWPPITNIQHGIISLFAAHVPRSIISQTLTSN